MSTSQAPISGVPVTAPANIAPTTFFGKLKSWFTRLFSKAASAATVLTMTKSALLNLAPIIEGIVELADPTAEPALAGVLSSVQTGLAAAGATLDGAAPNGSTASLITILNSVKVNLQSLFVAGQIKNPETLKTYTALATMAINEIEAIITEFSGK